MRFCNVCGSSVEDDAVFCTKCGNTLSGFQPEQEIIEEVYGPPSMMGKAVRPEKKVIPLLYGPPPFRPDLESIHTVYGPPPTKMSAGGRRCTECGKMLPERAKFCYVCGTKLTERDASESEDRGAEPRREKK